METMAQSPRISVAMSVYNSEAFLTEAIESILAQSFADFEFLILNDGSSDGSGAIIERFAASDSRIIAINRENRGLISSINELLDAARAPYLARMDSDDIAESERFAQQIAFLDSHPDHGVVGSWSRDMAADGSLLPAVGPDQPIDHDALAANIMVRSPLCHPSVMMRTAEVRAAGGYRRAYRHCEDYDLWLRLVDRTKMANIPKRLLRYRRSAGQVTAQYQPAMHYGSAVARMARRYRLAGKPDPTTDLDALPPLEQLETLFPDSRDAQTIRDEVYRNMLFSKAALTSPVFDDLLAHVRFSSARPDYWRAVARLAVTMREPARAIRLAGALLSR
jgi:glycosyltransferase involved in cell wall biosynthesis